MEIDARLYASHDAANTRWPAAKAVMACLQEAPHNTCITSMVNTTLGRVQHREHVLMYIQCHTVRHARLDKNKCEFRVRVGSDARQQQKT